MKTPDLSKYKYCNYCKHLKLTESFPTNCGICTRPQGFNVYDPKISRVNWNPCCRYFEYTIHPVFGYDSEEELKQYKDNCYFKAFIKHEIERYNRCYIIPNKQGGENNRIYIGNFRETFNSSKIDVSVSREIALHY